MTANIEKGSFLGQRHLQILLLFLAIIVNYINKFNVGVAVVAMTNSATTNPNFNEFDWTEMQKSFILSSFFWGYFLTQSPGGYLCRRFGVKIVLLIATSGSSLLGFLPPLCVSWGGWQIYCAIRVGQGLFQGFLFPCVHAQLAAWCPVPERNRLGALANTGIECGTLLAMYLCGMVATSPIGWPGVFYVPSAIGVLWCMIWLLLASNSPLSTKNISKVECNYIESSKNPANVSGRSKTENATGIPWRAIMTSVPFWALLVARSAHSWGFSTLQAEIPSYMNGVLLMNMKDNALYSALPYLAMWCMSYAYLLASEILLNRGIASLAVIRKTFNTLATWGPALGLIGVSFLGIEHKVLAIILMTVNVGINSGSTIGSALNTIDLSPNHAGVLMGIVNTAANIIPILTPLLVGFIVRDQHNRLQWQLVFVISALVFGGGNLFYIIFGSTKLQPWDAENYNSDNNNATTDTKIIEQKIEKAKQ